MIRWIKIVLTNETQKVNFIDSTPYKVYKIGQKSNIKQNKMT